MYCVEPSLSQPSGGFSLRQIAESVDAPVVVPVRVRTANYDSAATIDRPCPNTAMRATSHGNVLDVRDSGLSHWGNWHC
jgi:hypothetical protein